MIKLFGLLYLTMLAFVYTACYTPEKVIKNSLENPIALPKTEVIDTIKSIKEESKWRENAVYMLTIGHEVYNFNNKADLDCFLEDRNLVIKNYND